MTEHESQKVSRFAFEKVSPRRRKMYFRRLIMVAVLITVAVSIGCVRSIDKECSLGLEPLPEEAYSDPVPAPPIEPEYPLYDIPLSPDLQKLTYEWCMEWNVDPVMVYGIVDTESEFRADLISETDDYGLMQINKSNHQYIIDSLGPTNFLDPAQNIRAGVFFLSGICKSNTDPEKILMVYKMSGSVAQAMWDVGRESTWYSREVLRTMDEIRERQVET